MGRYQLGGGGKGAAAAKWPEKHQYGGFRGDAKPGKQGGGQIRQGVYGPGGPQHIDGSQQRNKGRENPGDSAQPFGRSVGHGGKDVRAAQQSGDGNGGDDDRRSHAAQRFHRRKSAASSFATRMPAVTEPAEAIQTAGRMSKGASAPLEARTAAMVVGSS